MSDTVIASIFALIGVLFSGISGVVIAKLAKLNDRMRRLEHRDRLSWLYIRSLIDHAYRHGATPLPEPPEGWLDDP